MEVLKEKNLKIGVATSSTREHALDNFEREQITHYFDSIIDQKQLSTVKNSRYIPSEIHKSDFL